MITITIEDFSHQNKLAMEHNCNSINFYKMIDQTFTATGLSDISTLWVRTIPGMGNYEKVDIWMESWQVGRPNLFYHAV